MSPTPGSQDEGSKISRWVVFLLGPLVLLASSFVAIKAKQWFNYDLSPAATAAYLFGIIGGLAALIWKWVHNRGEQELAKAVGVQPAEVEAIVSQVIERLPNAPSAPTTPGSGSPASPRAPGGQLR